MGKQSTKKQATVSNELEDYGSILSSMMQLVENARHTSARSVNAIMTAAYWEIGRRIVEYEQGGAGRAICGGRLIERLSQDLGKRFGRGFSQRYLEQMRLFFLTWTIPQTVFAESQEQRGAIIKKAQIPSAQSSLNELASRFPLPWSAYVRLLAV